MNGVIISRFRQKFVAVLRGINQGRCFKPTFMKNKTDKWGKMHKSRKERGLAK
jgi:hypothetical protein